MTSLRAEEDRVRKTALQRIDGLTQTREQLRQHLDASLVRKEKEKERRIMSVEEKERKKERKKVCVCVCVCMYRNGLIHRKQRKETSC